MWLRGSRPLRPGQERLVGPAFTLRFVPTFRTIISLPAGMARMPTGRFLAFTFAGSAVWNAALITGGYVLGTRFRAMEDWIAWLGVAISALVVVWYIYRVLIRRLQRAR